MTELEKIFHFAIFDINNKIIKKSKKYDETIDENNIDDEHTRKMELDGIPIKIIKYQLKNGFLILYTTSKDMIRSRKRFSFALNTIVFFADSILIERKEIEAPLKKQYGVLVHNMKSLNAHIQQEVYNIIPQDKLVNSLENKVEVIENLIKSKSNESAKAILKILHSSTGLKMEFSVYSKLFHSNPTLSKNIHSIHKVLLNMLYGFFPDFTDNHIKVNVSQSYAKGYFDYESIHVAFYYVLENAVKYVKNDSEINIYFKNSDSDLSIYFEMISLKILPTEINKIYNEGYSGIEAKKKSLAGSGLGMSRAKKILQLNDGSIMIQIDNDRIYADDYQKNIIKITLPLASIKKK